ncbi:MAG TPA: 23S rRNA (adenine(2030)-N(6))-methyltransferase RlmJ [Gammaproteobacteria bacterium]|nr:23S rRNA (adenine(2030)-N(6))-methyltransferase RlmJ [Gammaproteobacteria bacterium]
MNYKHSYHAGGFSDVLKHIVVIAIMNEMIRKDKPLCYVDTHAGRGLYHLGSAFAKKTDEFVMGVQKLLSYYHASNSIRSVPKLIETYIRMIQRLGYPEYYAGSPLIAEAFLRETDRLILMELQSEEHRILQKNVRGDHRIAVHHQDGYLGLKAFLPPSERRGLTLIDPAFEKPEEWKQLLASIKVALKQFPTGVFAIWYPIKDLWQVKHFLKSIASLGLESAVIAELGIYPQDAPLSLMGSGMLIINPPWQCTAVLEETLPWVWKALAVNEAGGWRVQKLVF